MWFDPALFIVYWEFYAAFEPGKVTLRNVILVLTKYLQIILVTQ